MADEQSVQTREWVMKAASDYRSARALAAVEPPATDTAAFHCQQAVEKLFKAFLTFHAQVFEKTHHLVLLCQRCTAIDEAFRTFEHTVASVQDYAVAFRYPGEADPTLEEVHDALGVVDAVWTFVATRLPEDIFVGLTK